MSREPGRVYREAWIDAVGRHYPGVPEPATVVPWPLAPDWERQAAEAVYAQIRQFVLISAGATARLSREQRGRFVAICWNAQIFKHFVEPAAGYVGDWEDLPDWQRQSDCDVFDAIAAEPG